MYVCVSKMAARESDEVSQSFWQRKFELLCITTRGRSAAFFITEIYITLKIIWIPHLLSESWCVDAVQLGMWKREQARTVGVALTSIDCSTGSSKLITSSPAALSQGDQSAVQEIS